MTNLRKNFYNKFYGEEINICLTNEQIERLIEDLSFIKNNYAIFNASTKEFPIIEAISSKQTFLEFKKCYEEISKQISLEKEVSFVKTLFNDMGDMFSLNIEYCKKLNILILEEVNNTLNLLKLQNNEKYIKENLFNLSFYFGQLYFLTSLMGTYFKESKLEYSYTVIMTTTQMFYEESMNIFNKYLEWEDNK